MVSLVSRESQLRRSHESCVTGGTRSYRLAQEQAVAAVDVAVRKGLIAPAARDPWLSRLLADSNELKALINTPPRLRVPVEEIGVDCVGPACRVPAADARYVLVTGEPDDARVAVGPGDALYAEAQLAWCARDLPTSLLDQWPRQSRQFRTAKEERRARTVVALEEAGLGRDRAFEEIGVDARRQRGRAILEKVESVLGAHRVHMQLPAVLSEDEHATIAGARFLGTHLQEVEASLEAWEMKWSEIATSPAEARDWLAREIAAVERRAASATSKGEAKRRAARLLRAREDPPVTAAASAARFDRTAATFDSTAASHRRRLKILRQALVALSDEELAARAARDRFREQLGEMLGRPDDERERQLGVGAVELDRVAAGGSPL